MTADVIYSSREMATELRKLADRYVGMLHTEIRIQMLSLADKVEHAAPDSMVSRTRASR